MSERTVRIGAAEGLHARPAALFVHAVRASGANVTVRKGDKSVSASSILGIITLGVMQGDEVVVSSTDDGIDSFLDELVDLLSRADH